MEFVHTVDLSKFLTNPEEALEDCKNVVSSFHKTGILIIKDPRVTQEDNSTFIDLVEKYFSQSDELKMKDTRPELMYQVGPTPAFTEKPRDRTSVISQIPEEHKPIIPTGKDAKWRFFWPMGNAPKDTKYAELNSKKVIPENFPEWEFTMNKWGKQMLSAVETVCEMFALGCGLQKNFFEQYTNTAPHLLAPTATDLGRYGDLKTIMAGFHTDLSFIAIHGKSRYPGLHAWLRDGTKFQVRVPDGCLLLQAGMQFEYITAGYVLAGFHEVVVNDNTLKAIEVAKQEGRCLWRISSTLFTHINSDAILKPLAIFENEPDANKYPPITTGDFVIRELKAINLSGKDSEFVSGY